LYLIVVIYNGVIGTGKVVRESHPPHHFTGKYDWVERAFFFRLE
jgi:hypothetical protein